VAERKEISQMIGEFLREAAVLVAVLFPLEDGIANHGHLDWTNVLLAEVMACILVGLGIILEGREEL
jgi:hypothetical protein